jgi:ankyrin repeat protein
MPWAKKQYGFFIILLLFILIAVGLFFVAFLNSDLFLAYKLNHAIREENIDRCMEIISKKPSCINTYPSLAPQWWQSEMIEDDIYYPLGTACMTGNQKIVNMLLEHGADPNIALFGDYTPLALTYYYKPNNWYMTSLALIASGASLDVEGCYPGGNILTDIVTRRASKYSQYGQETEDEVNRAFYYALENCDRSNINWMRVLQHCVTYDRTELVQYLLEKQFCNVNDTSVGMTALMFAARDSTTEMVSLLLNYGADPDILSNAGKSALDYAHKYGTPDVIALLESIG